MERKYPDLSGISVPLCLFVLFLLSPVASGETWRVPEGFAGIQEAIDSAKDEDTVIVAQGTYVGAIRFKGKNILLQSSDPDDDSVVAKTILDVLGDGAVVYFQGSEGPAAVLAGFTIQNGGSTNGGGIASESPGSRATIRRNVIKENSATFGGAIYGCSGLIEQNTITGNSATTHGGALYRCQGTIRNNTISINGAGSNGGGLYQCSGTVVGNTISSNTAGANGAGLYDCDGLIQGNWILSNEAEGEGGGLHQCDGSIRDNRISFNKADNGAGAYLCLGDFHRNRMHDNIAVRGGAFGSCDGTIRGNEILKNSAQQGGALFDCDGRIYNNYIYSNSASSLGGALDSCEGSIFNNTIYANHADGDGGGLSGGVGVLRNNIIWGNTAPKNPQLSTNAVPYFCCIEGWSSENGNISTNPRFTDTESRDLSLRKNSPCIDAGAYVPELTEDVDGERRPQNGTSLLRGDGSDFDIGADEYSGATVGEDFRIDVLNSLQAVNDGRFLTYDFAVIPVNGFEREVILGLAYNVSHEFFPASATPPFNATLRIDATGLPSGAGQIRFSASTQAQDIVREATVEYMKSISGGISIKPRRTEIALGDSTLIEGRVFPATNSEDVELEANSTTLGTIRTDNRGQFTYLFTPDKAGPAQLEAQWTNATGFLSTASTTISVLPKPSSVSLRADVKNFIPADGQLDFSGQIAPAPNATSATVEVVVQYLKRYDFGPDSNLGQASESTIVNVEKGKYRGSLKFSDTGDIRIRARYPGEPPNSASGESPALVLRVTSSTQKHLAVNDYGISGAGASDIIVGADSDNLPKSVRDYLANLSYLVLSERQYTDTDQVYANDDPSQDVDGDGSPDDVVDIETSTSLTIAQTLNEVKDQVSPSDPVSIFLIGEKGSGESLEMADGTILPATSLDGYLDGFLGTTRDIRILVESSNAGDFCYALAAPNRTVICSASEEEASYFSNGLLSFSQLFLSQTRAGYGIAESFDYTVDYLNAALGFFGVQTPLLIEPEDFDIQNLYYGVSSDGEDLILPVIDGIFEPLLVLEGDIVEIFAFASDDTSVASVQAFVTDPNGERKALEMTDSGQGKYSRSLDGELPLLGVYGFSIIAKDSSGNVSIPRESEIVVSSRSDLNYDRTVDRMDLYLLLNEMDKAESLYDIIGEDGLDSRDLFYFVSDWSGH